MGAVVDRAEALNIIQELYKLSSHKDSRMPNTLCAQDLVYHLFSRSAGGGGSVFLCLFCAV